MTLYIPLDVDYSSDQEFCEVHPLAELLYVRALCFAKRKMTDGVITRGQLAEVAIRIPTPAKHAAQLVEVGLWTMTGAGWQIDAFLKRNPSKQEILAARELSKEAGVRGNHERWHVGEDGKPSPKCPLCVRDRIGLPDRGANRVGSPKLKPEPEPYTEPKPEPLTKPIRESHTSLRGADDGLGGIIRNLLPRIDEATA